MLFGPFQDRRTGAFQLGEAVTKQPGLRSHPCNAPILPGKSVRHLSICPHYLWGSLRWIRRLIDRGHLDQIVISHDICYRSRLMRFGGHGYGHIFENVLPLMRRRGFTEAEIERMTVGTPQRLLTFA
jgi:hypothetical protein